MYLGCGVRTVQRWEKLGMPVRRPVRGTRSRVVAISEELDAWIKGSSPATGDSTSSQGVAGLPRQFHYRILLADDDEKLLVALTARLADEGYDVRTARDGFEALAAMREATPDLLVSDLRMPNMSGFELLSIVRKRFPAMAVIAYSGEFVTAGNPSVICDRYIDKRSVSSTELLRAIGELLSQSPLRTQPARLMPAPAWVPRSINGYVVLTCPDCLRSFSVTTRNAIIGADATIKCFYCGVDVNYHIDDSVLPIQDDLEELIRYSQNHIASLPPAHPRNSTRVLGTRKAHRQ